MEATKPISEMTADEIIQLGNQKKEEELKKLAQRKKAAETDKNNFLNEVLTRFKEINGILSNLKSESIMHAENFNSLKYQLEGKPVKEAKSFELKNENVKIVVESQDRFDFNDSAIVHINAIKDIFKAKFENRNKGMYDYMETFLIKNSKGDYDVKLLAKARNKAKQLGDMDLLSELDKLQDCLIVVGSAKYIRLYTKDDKNRWKDVSLNFSSL